MARRPGAEIARNLVGHQDFVKLAGAAAVLPPVLTARVKGQTATSSMPANNRISIGVIGMGPAGSRQYPGLSGAGRLSGGRDLR